MYICLSICTDPLKDIRVSRISVPGSCGLSEVGGNGQLWVPWCGRWELDPLQEQYELLVTELPHPSHIPRNAVPRLTTTFLQLCPPPTTAAFVVGKKPLHIELGCQRGQGVVLSAQWFGSISCTWERTRHDLIGPVAWICVLACWSESCALAIWPSRKADERTESQERPHLVAQVYHPSCWGAWSRRLTRTRPSYGTAQLSETPFQIKSKWKPEV